MNVFISQNFYQAFVKAGLLCNTQLCNRLIKWFIHYVILLICILCVCVCLFTFEVRFKRLFAPTSWSQMSKIFSDSESLGKGNGNKWSQIWKPFTNTGCKISAQKKVVFGWILPYWVGFFFAIGVSHSA